MKQEKDILDFLIPKKVDSIPDGVYFEKLANEVIQKKQKSKRFYLKPILVSGIAASIIFGVFYFSNQIKNKEIDVSHLNNKEIYAYLNENIDVVEEQVILTEILSEDFSSVESTNEKDKITLDELTDEEVMNYLEENDIEELLTVKK